MGRRLGAPALLVALLVGIGACAGPKRADLMRPDLEPVVVTEDGWRLPVRRYGGQGPPVVLVHGLSATGRTWDLFEERSLIPGLVADGWDVWVLSWRGDEGSQAPDRRSRWRYGFDDHLRRDLPAALDHIADATGYARVAWVGHSMGGTLLYGTLRDRPERVGVGVTIGSPASFARPLKPQRANLRFRGEGRVPVRGIGRFAVRLGAWRVVERRLAPEGALGRAVAEQTGWSVSNPTTRRMLRLAATWVRSGQVVDEQGDRLLVDAPVPVLALAGPADRTVSWHDARYACEVLSDCTFVPLSREAGRAYDHGHLDPVLGRTAPLEVFPVVRDFLRRHRGRVGE